MTGSSEGGGDGGGPSRLEVRMAWDPAVRMFIFAGMLLGFGIWCLMDQKQPPQKWDVAHINDVSTYVLNNILGPFVFLPLGVVFLAWGVVFIRRRLVGDEQGLRLGRRQVAWADVTELDATLLKSKGFLRLRHARGVLTLDSWKLDHPRWREVVAFVERHVAPEKVKTP